MSEQTSSSEDDSLTVKIGWFEFTKKGLANGTIKFILFLVVFFGLLYIIEWSYQNNGIITKVIHKNPPNKISKEDEFYDSFVTLTNWVSKVESNWSELSHVVGNSDARAKMVNEQVKDVLAVYSKITEKDINSLGVINKIVYFYNLAQLNLIAADVYRDDSYLISADEALKTVQSIYDKGNVFSESDIEYLETYLPQSKIDRIRLFVSSLRFIFIGDENSRKLAKIEMLKEYRLGCKELDNDTVSRIEHYDVLWAVECKSRIPKHIIQQYNIAFTIKSGAVTN